MYGVNAGVPKTLVSFVIKWVIENRLQGPDEDQGFSSDNKKLAKSCITISYKNFKSNCFLWMKRTLLLNSFLIKGFLLDIRNYSLKIILESLR